ncbi:MAG: hypothetical protein RBU21_11990 [FCB group bacterium]|jgi:hypothetical protein|nr:hypothetical protein [FCB group bacterium]
MNLAAAFVLLIALVGPTDKPATGAIAVTMVAVEATDDAGEANAKREKHFSADLDVPTCNALKELPYTNFRKIAAGSTKTDFEREARLRIDDTYTLCVAPLSKDEKGLIRTKVWIEERREDADAKEPVRKALVTTVKAVSGDKMILGGLKLKKGDLVVALTLKG